MRANFFSCVRVTAVAVAMALGGTVAAAAPTMASTIGEAVTPTAAPYTAFVTNGGDKTMTPIDLATNTVGAPIATGTTAGVIAITPNGSTAYVAGITDLGAYSVTPIDLATNTAGTPILVGDNPVNIAITPDGATAYVANYTANNFNVSVIDIATNTLRTIIPGGSFPVSIAIAPNGATAYVSDRSPFGGVSTVTPIDTATDTPRTPIPVGNGRALGSIVITPDGRTAYVASEPTFFGGSGVPAITPIDLATGTAGTPIPVGSVNGSGDSIGVSPDGTKVYVTNSTSNTVSVIDTASNAVTVTIPTPPGPGAISITSDGTKAYVVCQAGTVTPIDLATNTAGTPIAVRSASGIAITP